MDDRALLLAAAKAHDGGEGDAFHLLAADLWNPLLDDGDALRLAVKLGLEISQASGAAWIGLATDPQHSSYLHEPYGDDPCAATRRAIVRAAAAIGGEHG